VMMAFASLVPVVGSALVWIPVSVSLMVGGHLVRGILVIIFCVIVSSLADSVIRPLLISGRAQMGGLLIFISVLGGITVFGMLGIVLGPIVVVTAASVLDLYAPSRRIGNTVASASGK
jgi:predicted PurR-regulated permease PerM